MKSDRSKIRQKSKGESPSKANSKPNCSSHPTSFNKKMCLRKTASIGESNDRCSRGGDGEDPPHGKIEKSHALDHPWYLLRLILFPNVIL
jgi:hypothetical protein